ncbi:MAG: DUF58 domain-containing protein [Planctomycetota bacterium]
MRKTKKRGWLAGVRRIAGFLLRFLNVGLAGGVILALFAQAWGLALALLLLDVVLASSIRVQRATREVRLGFLDLFSRCIRVTRFGYAFLALSLLIGVAALNTGANLLYLMFGVFLSMVLVSGVSATVGLSRLRFRRHLPAEIYAGDEFLVKLDVTNGKRVFPVMGLLVRDSPEDLGKDVDAKGFVMKIGPRGTGTIRYVARIDRRGAFTFDRLAISTRFPFGIVEILFDIPMADEVVVLPRLGQLRETVLVEAERSDENLAKRAWLRGIEESFKGLRDFREGDNPRHIHWKTSAKHGKLLLREFDRREERNVCIFFDTYVGSRGDGALAETFERAVSFVATVLAELARQGYEICLVLYGPEFFAGAGGGEARRIGQLLQVLALAQPTRRHDVRDLLDEGAPWAIGCGNAILVRVCEEEIPGRPERREAWNGGFRVFVADAPEFARQFILTAEAKHFGPRGLEPAVVVA